ncbi:ATP-dependent Clp protease adapter ClpS [Candidatus Cyanaurora vandensis]|uniref:ATP-dependent Clp protease adapter ClpS n=1 Tax=Candidatus Cyanaurora vandensis TaxID=2714958 RepID=UPI00257AD294|nr:ATP-dependent Clp protease adapter ClpS [Candidatus Cyanaurora vandensis]
MLTRTPQAVAAPGTLVNPATRSQSAPPPQWKVIVLNDDFNTFQHVHRCLMRYIPGVSDARAWELTNQVHEQGAATVWVGDLEQAELYIEQLKREGLTVAPPERD